MESKIDYLVRLNRNRARTRAILADIFKCLAYTGELNVHLFNQEGALPVAEEVLLVKGKEGLLMIDKGEELDSSRESNSIKLSGKSSHVNAAIYLEERKNDDSRWLHFLISALQKTSTSRNNECVQISLMKLNIQL